jgi:hypothetical protein
MSAADVANEAVWLQKFIIELGVFPSVDNRFWLTKKIP